MVFLSYRGVPMVRKGLWRELPEFLAGYRWSKATFQLPPAGNIRMLVLCGPTSGRWKATLNGSEYILDLFNPTPQMRSYELFNAQTPVAVAAELCYLSTSHGWRGGAFHLIGFELDADVPSDVPWCLVDGASPRQRILANPYLSMDERLSIAGDLNWQRSVDVVEGRYRRSTDGRHYPFGPYRIHFIPPWASHVPPPDIDRQGLTSVIIETFIWPALFCEEVQAKPGDTVLDVGANIGTTALLFSELVGAAGHVIAVEPVLHPVLQENLQTNRIRNVTVCPVAVDERPGMATMYATPYVLDTSLIAEHSSLEIVAKFDVAVDTLDNLVEGLALNKVDLIKMDIEGVEEEAIRGAKEVIARFRPKWSISSYHKDRQRRPQHERLVNLLREFNYRIKETKAEHIFAW